MIVTVTPTIMDGTVVRWFLTEGAARNVRPIVSASRNGVRIDGWLHDLPEGLLDTARQAWHTLQRRGDVEHLATHRSVLMSDVLLPIVRPAVES